MDATEKSQVLLFVGDREPVLEQAHAGAHEHALELWHRAEEVLVFLRRAEAHHVLDAGAVVPAAVEQHDLAAGRQVRHVALEVPLRALAIVRCRQRHHAADARIEPLGDALDGAALARRVAPLEQDHHLLLRGGHPVLQLHQLRLQPEELLEVAAAVVLVLVVGLVARQRVMVLDLHLELFVITVGKVATDAADDLVVKGRWL